MDQSRFGLDLENGISFDLIMPEILRIWICFKAYLDQCQIELDLEKGIVHAQIIKIALFILCIIQGDCIFITVSKNLFQQF